VPHFETPLEYFYCLGDSVLYGGVYYSSPQLIRILLVDIQETERFFSYFDEEICEGESIWIYGEERTEEGVYFDTLLTASGCDSVLITQLFVAGDTETFLLEILCEGETVMAGGELQSTDGVYTDHYEGYNGCDSIVYTTVVVRYPNRTFFKESICEGESVSIYGELQTEAGFYESILTGINGCDSIITTELTVIPKDGMVYDYVFCEGDSIEVEGIVYYETTILRDTFASTVGCDSIVQINITELRGNVDEFYQEYICEGDSILINGNWEKENGEFVRYASTDLSCDSIITTELIVIPKIEFGVYDASYCEGEDAQFFIPNNPTSQIRWNPTDYLSCDDCFDPITNTPNSLRYIGAYTDVCYEEPEPIPLVVQVKQYPGVAVSADADLLRGDTIQLTASTEDTNAILTWYTNYDDTLCYGCDTVLVTPQMSSNFRVVADNGNGCPSEDDINVNVHTSCEYGYLRVPNIILPKTGNYGSELEIDYKGMEIHVLRIFNRWGELVFETEDINDKWDGTYRGEDLNPGVYVYYIIGRCLNEELFIYKGNITLIN